MHVVPQAQICQVQQVCKWKILATETGPLNASRLASKHSSLLSLLRLKNFPGCSQRLPIPKWVPNLSSQHISFLAPCCRGTMLQNSMRSYKILRNSSLNKMVVPGRARKNSLPGTSHDAKCFGTQFGSYCSRVKYQKALEGPKPGISSRTLIQRIWQLIQRSGSQAPLLEVPILEL